MKAFFKLILCFGFVLSLSAQESSSLNKTVSPSIEFTPTENEITVRFSVFNKEQVNKSIRYQAVVVTKTKDNAIYNLIVFSFGHYYCLISYTLVDLFFIEYRKSNGNFIFCRGKLNRRAHGSVQ